MKFRKTDIINTAGVIILQSGIDALTIEELVLKMGISHKELSMYLKYDKDILIMLLISLESEIQQLIKDLTTSKQSPEEELQNLFISLNKLFERKPFYMDLIFENQLAEKEPENLVIINRIIKRVERFLLQVIDKGKKENLFHSGSKTRYMVNRILVSFRRLMNEQRITEVLVRDIALLKSNKYAD